MEISFSAGCSTGVPSCSIRIAANINPFAFTIVRADEKVGGILWDSIRICIVSEVMSNVIHVTDIVNKEGVAGTTPGSITGKVPAIHGWDVCVVPNEVFAKFDHICIEISISEKRVFAGSNVAIPRGVVRSVSAGNIHSAHSGDRRGSDCHLRPDIFVVVSITNSIRIGVYGSPRVVDCNGNLVEVSDVAFIVAITGDFHFEFGVGVCIAVPSIEGLAGDGIDSHCGITFVLCSTSDFAMVCDDSGCIDCCIIYTTVLSITCGSSMIDEKIAIAILLDLYG